jgi:hypothetical protein
VHYHRRVWQVGAAYIMGRGDTIGPGLTANDFSPIALGVAGLTVGEPKRKMPGVIGGRVSHPGFTAGVCRP